MYIPIVSAIEVRGNTKTQDYVLRREILHPLNNPLDTTIVTEDRNRLDNLGLFSESIWQVVPLEDGTAKLIYVVTESIHRTPPLALPTYNEDTGWSLAGGEVKINFWLWGAVLVASIPMVSILPILGCSVIISLYPSI